MINTKLVMKNSSCSFLISQRLSIVSSFSFVLHESLLFVCLGFVVFSAPFTVQRICEVIVHPDHFTETNSLLFGLEKLVSVSTVQKTLTPAEVEVVNEAIAAAAKAEAAAAVKADSTDSTPPQSPVSDTETKMA